MATSYQMNICPPRDGSPSVDHLWRHYDMYVTQANGHYPVVVCHAHDEVFYHPRERHLDDNSNLPFLVALYPDGSVRAARTDLPRTNMFGNFCGNER